MESKYVLYMVDMRSDKNDDVISFFHDISSLSISQQVALHDTGEVNVPDIDNYRCFIIDLTRRKYTPKNEVDINIEKFLKKQKLKLFLDGE